MSLTYAQHIEAPACLQYSKILYFKEHETPSCFQCSDRNESNSHIEAPTCPQYSIVFHK